MIKNERHFSRKYLQKTYHSYEDVYVFLSYRYVELCLPFCYVVVVALPFSASLGVIAHVHVHVYVTDHVHVS